MDLASTVLASGRYLVRQFARSDPVELLWQGSRAKGQTKQGSIGRLDFKGAPHAVRAFLDAYRRRLGSAQ